MIQTKKNKWMRKLTDDYQNKMIQEYDDFFKKRLHKTIKNKSKLKKCERFCRNFVRSNKGNSLDVRLCKKSYCNPTCVGYDFLGDRKEQTRFRKKIKNGFTKRFSQKKRDSFLKKGALSGCVDLAK